MPNGDPSPRCAIGARAFHHDEDARERALRLVLAVALDCGAVAECLGRPTPTDLWPSTLYAWAAAAAVRSSIVWRRCARALDVALAPWLGPYQDASAAAIVGVLSARDAATAMTRHEIAAALWAIVRRHDPALARTSARLAMEAELLLVRAGGASA